MNNELQQDTDALNQIYDPLPDLDDPELFGSLVTVIKHLEELRDQLAPPPELILVDIEGLHDGQG